MVIGENAPSQSLGGAVQRMPITHGDRTMRTIACCLLLAVALPCHAQREKSKPNTLTPKEIADGWFLLFDGETTFGWTWSPLEKSDLVIKNNMIDLSDMALRSITTSVEFSEFELQFEYRSSGINSGYVGVYTREPLERFPMAGSINTYLREAKKWTPFVVRSQDGLLKAGDIRPAVWKYQTPIRFTLGKGAEFQVRSVKLRPLNMKPLFDGKDLDGWKEFPGKKSKFAVVDGAITVKDGPGDLQTVGKYKDFVLQAECISHGKHLNSGIFFRCRDGEYQNGYEAQIHNGFDEKPKKYLIEEYDPKTNKLTGKKEMMFNAIDYGTGAIYRRMPARKQMAKDGEWFTMTVVAHGNHIATWVNGVQVTDWTDNRPKSDNARTGCKLEAGHISIQGHDPTTNLSFKNIRIAELK
jgi:hypothetical protein